MLLHLLQRAAQTDQRIHRIDDLRTNGPTERLDDPRCVLATNIRGQCIPISLVFPKDLLCPCRTQVRNTQTAKNLIIGSLGNGCTQFVLELGISLGRIPASGKLVRREFEQIGQIHIIERVRTVGAEVDDRIGKCFVVIIQPNAGEEADHTANLIHPAERIVTEQLAIANLQELVTGTLNRSFQQLALTFSLHGDRRDHIANPMDGDDGIFPQTQLVEQILRQNRNVIIANFIQEHRMFQLNLNGPIALSTAVQIHMIDLCFSSSRIELQCNLELIGTAVPTNGPPVVIIRYRNDHAIDRVIKILALLGEHLEIVLDVLEQFLHGTVDHFAVDHIFRNDRKVGQIVHALQIGLILTSLRFDRIEAEELKQVIIRTGRQPADDPSGGMPVGDIGTRQLEILARLLPIGIRHKALVLNAERMIGHAFANLDPIQTNDVHRLVGITTSLRIDHIVTLDGTVHTDAIHFRRQLQFDLGFGRKTKSPIGPNQEALDLVALLDTFRNGIRQMQGIRLVHVVVESRILDLTLLGNTAGNDARGFAESVRQILRQQPIVGNVVDDGPALAVVFVIGLTTDDQFLDCRVEFLRVRILLDIFDVHIGRDKVIQDFLVDRFQSLTELAILDIVNDQIQHGRRLGRIVEVVRIFHPICEVGTGALLGPADVDLVDPASPFRGLAEFHETVIVIRMLCGIGSAAVLEHHVRTNRFVVFVQDPIDHIHMITVRHQGVCHLILIEVLGGRRRYLPRNDRLVLLRVGRFRCLVVSERCSGDDFLAVLVLLPLLAMTHLLRIRILLCLRLRRFLLHEPAQTVEHVADFAAAKTYISRHNEYLHNLKCIWF